MKNLPIKTVRGNYILFKYMEKDGLPLIEIKDRNKKFWYYEFKDGEFIVVTVTAKSLFDELPKMLKSS